MRIVVVGASLGGVRAVQGLRRRGGDAELVLVGGRPGAPDGVAADLDGSFVAIAGGEGRLQAVIGFAAVTQLLPYRTLLLEGAGWDDALASA